MEDYCVSQEVGAAIIKAEAEIAVGVASGGSGFIATMGSVAATHVVVESTDILTSGSRTLNNSAMSSIVKDGVIDGAIGGGAIKSGQKVAQTATKYTKAAVMGEGRIADAARKLGSKTAGELSSYSAEYAGNIVSNNMTAASAIQADASASQSVLAMDALANLKGKSLKTALVASNLLEAFQILS